MSPHLLRTPAGVRLRFDKTVSRRERLLACRKIDTETHCWTWTRWRSAGGAGYGVLAINGRQDYAHRFAYEEFIGPIPEGMTVDHLCRNRGCINPAHLQAVPIGENVRRAIRIGHDHPNAPRTCKRGHDWSVTPPIVTQRANGTDKRDCRVCQEARRASYRRRSA